MLLAYETRCAICTLKHGSLLDAAHIVPDTEELASDDPNGLALCKIHHAAYDQNMLGITPDYRVEIATDSWRRSMGRCSATESKTCMAGR